MTSITRFWRQCLRVLFPERRGLELELALAAEDKRLTRLSS